MKFDRFWMTIFYLTLTALDDLLTQLTLAPKTETHKVVNKLMCLC